MSTIYEDAGHDFPAMYAVSAVLMLRCAEAGIWSLSAGAMSCMPGVVHARDSGSCAPHCLPVLLCRPVSCVRRTRRAWTHWWRRGAAHTSRSGEAGCWCCRQGLAEARQATRAAGRG